MKGIIFRAFLTHVEDQYGADRMEDMISQVELSTGGAYTSIGTYDHGELVQMLVVLSQSVGVGIPDLIRGFGESLFPVLMKAYPSVVEHSDDAFSLISSIDNYIHVEVKKLYPDAEMPKFICKQVSAEHMHLIYESNRGLADLAEGLLKSCFDYFKESAKITRTQDPEEPPSRVHFHLALNGGSDG